MKFRRNGLFTDLKINVILWVPLFLILVSSMVGSSQIVPSASAIEEGENPKIIVLDASTDDLQGYIRWPWGVTSSQIEIGDKQPFMKWDETKEGDTTFYDGWMNHYARLDREQKDLEGARDDAGLQLTFDVEQLTLKGSLNAHIVTALKWPCRYLAGDFAIFGCPGDYGNDVKEGLCEGWIEGDIDIPLVQEYKNSWRFNTEVPMTVKFYAKSIVSYSYWHPPSANRTVERTETLTLPCNVNGALSYFSEDKVLLSIWIQYTAGVEDLEGPSLNVMRNWGGYDCAVCRVTEWKEETFLALTGPENVDPGMDEAEFDLSWEGESIALDTVEWTLSYKDREGSWVDLETFQEDSVEGITVPREGAGGINEWHEAFLEHGTRSEGFRVLEMRAKAKSYDKGELVALSNTFSFRYRVSEELRLTVTGPQVVNPRTNRVQFNLSSEGPGVDLVRWVDWVFSYEDEDGRWGEPETKIVEGDISGCFVPKVGSGVNWDQWMEFAYGQGVKEGDKSVMAMRVQVKAVSFDEVELAASEVFEFRIEHFKRFNITLPEYVKVYSTQHNETKIGIDYGGTELTEPVKITLKDPPPAHIKIDFKTDTIPLSHFGAGEIHVNVTFDNSKRATPGSMNIPLIEKVTVVARSGDHETSKELTLKLYPPKWLIMYYLPADTEKPPLQEHELANLLDIVKATEANPNPKVGILVMLDLNTSWPDPNAKDPRLRSAPPLEGNTKRLEGNRATILQVVNGKLRILRDVGPVNMGYKDVLSYFVDYAQKKILAMQNVLIIGDHGGGIRGIAWDGHQKGHLSISDLGSTLGTRYMSVLAFDACLMGQVEVVDTLRYCAGYVVASEIPSPVDGLAYSSWMPMLLANPYMDSEELAKKMVETYKIEKQSHTLAAVKTGEMDALTTSINRLGVQLKQVLEADPANMGKVLKDILYHTWKANPEPYIDIKDFAQKLGSDAKITSPQVKAAAQNVVQAVDAAIISSKVEFWSLTYTFEMVMHDTTGLNGLSIFFWDKGSAGSNAATGNWYWTKFSQFPTFSNGGWGAFMKAYVAATKPKSTTVKLTHPGHELFLNVYDSTGRHVGYDPENPTRMGIDAEIEGALYLDMGNGTKIIILPEELGEFEVVVDGQFMEEHEEPYELTYSVIEGDEILFEETKEGTIEENTAHRTPVTLGTDVLVVGETTIESTEPEPEPEPEQEPNPRGIPGFPFESVAIGAALSAVLLWMIKRRN